MATVPPTGDSQKTRPLHEPDRIGQSDPSPTTPNATLGPYQIIRKLGQGGMGSVFEAENQTNGKRVALKLLSRQLLSTDDSVERFRRESQIAASINHPRSTFVFEAGEIDNQFYITMELMTGGTLKEVVEERGALPVEQAVDYVLDVIDGLQPAHEAGIVHRDLKPSNCFIDHEGRVKIGDFGLAKSFISDSSLTRTGTFMGTPQFAAPEQLRASEVDAKADIYALGGTLFYLLSGRAPFEGNSAQVIASIASDVPPEIHTIVDGIPRELSRVIHQSLDKDPARRQENLAELRSTLLPFSTRGASQADLGRRMAAFYLDALVCAVAIVVISQISGIVFVALSGYFANVKFEDLSLISTFTQFGVMLAYFAIPEWKYGVTLGKWLMGMRVIDHRNEAPGLAQALTRAAIIPGLAQLSVSLPAYYIGFGAPANSDLASLIDGGMKIQLFQLLSLMVNLLIMSTARKSNGYRGLHDFLTRTRVVRLSGALESTRPRNIPVTVPISVESSQYSIPGIESLQVLGKFSADDSPAVLLAKDSSLERDVWVSTVAEPDSVDHHQLGRLRSTQIRELAYRDDGQTKRLVTEALQGAPLLEYLERTRPMSWASLLPVVQDVALELIAQEKEGWPSTAFSCDRIWINQLGQVKFLDPRVPTIAGTSLNPDGPTAAGSSEPMKIIETLMDAIIRRHVVPEHVLEFREKLPGFRNHPQPLRIVEQELEAMEDLASRWTWIDRMGVAAATYGVEYWPLLSLAVVASLPLASTGWIAPYQLGLLLTLVGSGLILALGYSFDGGPVFRFSGVSVRQKRDLKPSSKWRCAIRNWISWSPALGIIGLLGMLAGMGINAESTASVAVDLEPTIQLAVSVILLALLCFILVLGLLISILSPSRGIVDLVCGTKLIRR